jgi:hypothetical protein
VRNAIRSGLVVPDTEDGIEGVEACSDGVALIAVDVVVIGDDSGGDISDGTIGEQNILSTTVKAHL